MVDIDQSHWINGTEYFTQVTDQNKAGNLYVVTLLSFCYIAIIFVVRFVVKYGMYTRDDWALLGSTILAIGQHVALLTALGGGLGKSARLLSEGALEDIEKAVAAHIYFFILSHCAAKVSIALLIQRLFANGRKRNSYVCWALVGSAAFFGVFSILSLAIKCPSPAFSLAQEDQCSNRFLRYQLITAIDIVSEVLLAVIPILLLIEVQLRLPDKLLVMAVFGVRSLDIVFSAMNLHSVHGSFDQRDIGLAVVSPLIWMQTELLWSIFAASVPCLKHFMRPFDKIDEDTWRSNNEMYASERSGGRSWRDPRDKDGAIPLENIKGHQQGNIVKASGNDRSMRPDHVNHKVVISSNGPQKVSDDDYRKSWGSQERIIKASTHWEVRQESSKDPYGIP